MIGDGQEEKGAGEDEAVHAFEWEEEGWTGREVKGVKEDGRSGKEVEEIVKEDGGSGKEGEGVKEKVGSG